MEMNEILNGLNSCGCNDNIAPNCPSQPIAQCNNGCFGGFGSWIWILLILFYSGGFGGGAGCFGGGADFGDLGDIFAQFFGGTSLLILVGVDLDTMSQVEALMKMHHQDGLVKKGKLRSRNL